MENWLWIVFIALIVLFVVWFIVALIRKSGSRSGGGGGFDFDFGGGGFGDGGGGGGGND